MTRFIRSAWVIGRRDFTATVLSKTFIFFLIAPLLPLIFGGVFGSISARVTTRIARPVVAIVGSKADFARLENARDQLAEGMGDESLVKIVNYAPDPNLAAQQRQLLASRDPPVRAVLSGDLDHPRLIGALASDDGTVAQLRLLIATARAGDAVSSVAIPVTATTDSSGSLLRERELTGVFAQLFLFFITLLLAGMVLSQLIEEKSNKVIEVIAAAMPIDAMFVGKLMAMLGASVVGIVVWVSAGALFVELATTGGIQSLAPPAVGWPVFLILGVIYFSTNYLLIGSVFMMIGAQATTSREVQTLSLPATFGQFFIFWLASKSIGAVDSSEGIAAAIFPLSSPLTMIGRAAQRAELWPHVIAVAWQILWVAVILRLGASLFRKMVLKSGAGRSFWKLRRA
jgi:ABC-2 type transport system permease protein